MTEKEKREQFQIDILAIMNKYKEEMQTSIKDIDVRIVDNINKILDSELSKTPNIPMTNDKSLQNNDLFACELKGGFTTVIPLSEEERMRRLQSASKEVKAIMEKYQMTEVVGRMVRLYR